MKLSVITEAGFSRRSFLRGASKAGAAVAGVPGGATSVLKSLGSSDDFFKAAIDAYDNLDPATKALTDEAYTKMDSANVWRYFRDGQVLHRGEEGVKGTSPALPLIGLVAKNTDFNDSQQVVDSFFSNGLLHASGFTKQALSSLISKAGPDYIKNLFKSSKQKNPLDLWVNLFDSTSGNASEFSDILGISLKEVYTVRDFISDMNKEDFIRWGQLDQYEAAEKVTRELIQKGFVPPSLVTKSLAIQKNRQNRNKKAAQKTQKRLDLEAKERKQKKDREQDAKLANPMHQLFERKLNKTLSVLFEDLQYMNVGYVDID